MYYPSRKRKNDSEGRVTDAEAEAREAGAKYINNTRNFLNMVKRKYF